MGRHQDDKKDPSFMIPHQIWEKVRDDTLANNDGSYTITIHGKYAMIENSLNVLVTKKIQNNKPREMYMTHLRMI